MWSVLVVYFFYRHVRRFLINDEVRQQRDTVATTVTAARAVLGAMLLADAGVLFCLFLYVLNVSLRYLWVRRTGAVGLCQSSSAV